jgi:hypothetical protein
MTEQQAKQEKKEEKTKGDKVEVETIPKRIAAIVLWKQVRRTLIIELIAIIGFVIVATFSAWVKVAGALVAGVLSVGIAWQVWNDGQYIKRLQREYKIDTKLHASRKTG